MPHRGLPRDGENSPIYGAMGQFNPAAAGVRVARMELYFAPLACSMVARVVATEAGVPLEYKQVELFARTLTDDGSPYQRLTPQGLVPLLVLDDGERLGEVTAIAQLLADLAPERGLLPAPGAASRYRVLSWLAWSASELHKRVLWPLANPRAPREAKDFARALSESTFDHLERSLGGREHIATSRFSLADAHLGWALAVAPLLRLELGERPALRDYAARMAARDSFAAALALELPLLGPALARQRATLAAGAVAGA